MGLQLLKDEENDTEILEYQLPSNYKIEEGNENESENIVESSDSEEKESDTSSITSESDDSDDISEVEPPPLEEGDVRNPFNGEVDPVLSWLSNTWSETPRVVIQEMLTDFVGVGAQGGKGDAYWNSVLDPNNYRNIGLGNVQSAQGDYGLQSVEEDNMWIVVDGDYYSLKTGAMYPRRLLPENDSDLLSDGGILEQIGMQLNIPARRKENQAGIVNQWMQEDGISYQAALAKLQTLANEEGANLVGHPAIQRVEAIKAALTQHNIDNPENKLGPTGDFGVENNRKMNWLFRNISRATGANISENQTIEQRNLEHGEGIIGVPLSYIIPITTVAAGIRYTGGKAGVPTNLPLINKAASTKFTWSLTGPGGLFSWSSGAKLIKSATDYSISSAIVEYAANPEKNNIANSIENLTGWDNPLAIDPNDENRTRRQKNALTDGLIIGPPAGVGMDYAVAPILKGGLRQLRRLPSRGNQLIDNLADVLIRTFNLEASDKQLELALNYQQKGPTVNVQSKVIDVEEVIPTERITGNKKPEIIVEEDIVQPKQTQEELDLQVEEARIRRDQAAEGLKKSSDGLITKASTTEPKDLQPKKTLSQGFQEDFDLLKASIEQGKELVYRQGQSDIRKASLVGIDTRLLDSTNVNEYPAKASRAEIQNHIDDLDVEFTTRNADLKRRSRENIEEYGGTDWPPEVREAWNNDFQNRNALSERQKILQDSITEYDTANQTRSEADEITIGGVEKELADEVAFREWLKDPGDPELKELFDEIEKLDAKTDKNINLNNKLIDKIDRELDKLDELIYNDKDITDEARAGLENAYQSLDAKRQDVKSNLAKNEKGSVINEESFIKYFGDLPPEKQNEILDQLRTNGAVTGMPGKIGEEPPSIDALKSKTKLSDILRDQLRGLAQSDARRLREIDRALTDSYVDNWVDAEWAPGPEAYSDEWIRRLSDTRLDSEIKQYKKYELTERQLKNRQKKIENNDPERFRKKADGTKESGYTGEEIIARVRNEAESDIRNHEYYQKLIEEKASRSDIIDVELIDDEAVLPTKFYHGAADKFTLDDSGHYSRMSSYGWGLYTTDNLKIANSYKKKNKADVKGKGDPTVYEIQEKKPVKFFDMEGEWKEEYTDALATYEEAVQLLDETLTYLEQGHGDKYFVPGTNKLNVRGVIEMMWEINNSAEILPSYEVGNIISTFQEYLEATYGYGGWSHIGGMGPVSKKGATLHQVKIYWKPSEQIDIVPTNDAVNEAIPKAVKDTPASKMLRQAADKSNQLNKQLKGTDPTNLNEQFALTEKPVAPSDLKSTLNRYKSIRYRHDRVSFDSDLDSAIYTITGHNRSKAHDRLVKWVVNELGIPEQTINDVARNIRRKITANKQKSPSSIVTIKDTKAWEKSGHLDLMFEEPKDLKDLIAKRDAEIYDKYQKGELTKEEYEQATNPQDPGDQLDPKNLQFAELPDLGSYGKDLGNGDPQQIMDELLGALTEQQQIRLSNELDRILGKDIADLFVARDFRPIAGEKQAAAYGGRFRAGTRRDVKGAWDAKKRLVILSMMHKGDFVSFDSAWKTLWHEAFHGIQDLYLTAVEKKLLAANRKKLIEVASRGFPRMSMDTLNGLKDKEVQAYAFAAWHKLSSEYKADSWARPFEKLTRVLVRTANALRGLGYNTWEEIFASSAKGEMSARTPATAREELQFEIDPDDLKETAKDYQEKIAKGNMSGEDAVQDAAMQSEVRRYKAKPKEDGTPRNREYIDRSREDIIAMNKAFEEAVMNAYSGRADLTGIEPYTTAEVVQQGIREIRKAGYDVDQTIRLYENARKGDMLAKDGLYAAAGILHHREYNMKLLTQLGFEWDNFKDGDDSGIAKRFLSAMEDQLKLDTAWATYTRVMGQGLKLAQISYEEALAGSVRPGAEVKQTAPKQDIEKAIKEGLTPKEGVLGEGVYFSSDSVPGQKGDVELYGSTLSDAPILDIASGAQRITELLNELNLGTAKVNADGSYDLTPVQQAGIRDYVTGKGYSGIRYGTDDMPNVKGGDQIIIYDTNTANRMIGSDAAQPPEYDGESPRTLLENAVKQTENFLDKKLPPGVKDSILKGELTPEVRQILDGMTELVYHIRNTPGTREGAIKLINKVPDGQLDPNTIANIMRNSLFFSVRTWMRATLGSSYRAWTLPMVQMLGEGREQLKAMWNLDGNALRLSNRRQALNFKLYSKYLHNMPYAVRMMVASMRHNETFVNVGRSQADWAIGKNLERSEQLELDGIAGSLKETETEGYHLDPDANPLSILAYHLDKYAKSTVGTFSARVLGGMDTFHSAMVGPSYEWIRIMEQELYKAIDAKGFEPGSEKSWRYAEERADEILLKHMEDIDLANGEVIKNGRLNSRHAKKAMDWVNFTDDIEVMEEGRTIQYGIRAAQEHFAAEGIKDPSSLQIIEFADAWVKQKTEDNSFRQAGQWAINMPGKLLQHQYGNNIWVNTTVALLRPTNRTPVNLLKSAIRGLPGPNVLVDSYWRDINSEDVFTKSRANGEVAFGLVTLGFGTMLINSGNIQCSGPASANVSERFEADRTGWQPWSCRFRVLGEWTPWYDVEMFDQLANTLGLLGAYTENANTLSEDGADGLFGGAVTVLGNTARQMGLGQTTKRVLGGLTDLADLVSEFQNDDIKVLSGSRWEVESAFTRKLGLFFPRFIDHARNAVDPVRRTIDPSELPPGLNMIENTLKEIILKTPGLSWTQPAYLHPITGNPIPTSGVPGNELIPPDQPWVKMFHDVIVPWNVTRTKLQSADPVDVEMLRLQGRGGTFQIWNKRMFNLKDRVLDQTELNRLVEIGTKEVIINGNTLHQALLAEINSPQYKGGTDPITGTTYAPLPTNDHGGNQKSRRAKALSAVIQPYIAEAKERFIEETDTGQGSLGELIKGQKADNEQSSYDAQYGIPVNQSSSVQSWQSLAS